MKPTFELPRNLKTKAAVLAGVLATSGSLVGAVHEAESLLTHNESSMTVVHTNSMNTPADALGMNPEPIALDHIGEENYEAVKH